VEATTTTVTIIIIAVGIGIGREIERCTIREMKWAKAHLKQSVVEVAMTSLETLAITMPAAVVEATPLLQEEVVEAQVTLVEAPKEVVGT